MFIIGLLWIALSLLVGYVGRRRKFGFWGYMFVSLFLTPLVGFLTVLSSDARKTIEARPTE